MLEFAGAVADKVAVARTKASSIDTMTGIIGELAFAEWFLGDWQKHDILNTKGFPDFDGRIEIKTSTFPFSDRLNLLVRQDYAAARQPECYVQIIIDAPVRGPKAIEAGWVCRISGWATSADVDAAPLRDFGNVWGGRGGYKCHHISISNLRDMDEFPIARK
ncbi:hypothetical protein [Paracoccus broussonetiae]|nr:hypothetical protein [Paracoccus sp. CPCC 101403]